MCVCGGGGGEPLTHKPEATEKMSGLLDSHIEERDWLPETGDSFLDLYHYAYAQFVFASYCNMTNYIKET